MDKLFSNSDQTLYGKTILKPAILAPWWKLVYWITESIITCFNELVVQRPDIPRALYHHHGCRCPGDANGQGISSHGIDYVRLMCPCLPSIWKAFNDWHHLMRKNYKKNKLYIDALVQDCSNSIANAIELLQSCTKPSILCFSKQCHI